MKKLSTLYKKDQNDLGRVVDEVNPENEWVFKSGIPTRKFDGTACAIIDGKLYKRFDLKLWRKKKGEMIVFTEEELKSKTPEGAIPCQDPDEKSGHWPHWVHCKRNDNSCKYHFLAFDLLENKEDGTYELCGEKVQGNPEKIDGQKLIKHGCEVLKITDFSFQSLNTFLQIVDIEGIVFHDTKSNKMCKIRKSDFGIRR